VAVLEILLVHAGTPWHWLDGHMVARACSQA
jgi:hypothetical protein